MDDNIKKSAELKKENKLEKLNVYFIEIVFNILKPNKKLLIIKQNKRMQKKLNVNINDYIENYKEIKFSQIEIEITLAENGEGDIINIFEKEREYFHIYYNNNKEEIKAINKHEYPANELKIRKIKIIIDYQVESFFKLFSDCTHIESINFIKFDRNNINNMSKMFNNCLSLKELNITNFCSKNVKNMSFMFDNCGLLTKLNLAYFITDNVDKLF